MPWLPKDPKSYHRTNPCLINVAYIPKEMLPGLARLLTFQIDGPLHSPKDLNWPNADGNFAS